MTQQIQAINLNPGEFKVPQLDFSWLANLPATYQQSKLNQAKIGETQRREGAIAELGKLDPSDPLYAQKVAGIAMRMGDFGSGASLLKTAEEQALRRSAPTLGGPAPATPAVAPAAPDATPPLPPARPAIAPQAAPGVPGVPGAPSIGAPSAPGQAPAPPIFARPPTPVAAAPAFPNQPAAPIMAQPAIQRTIAGYAAAPDKRGVNFAGVNQELLQVANEVGNQLYGQLKRPLLITSARDSEHTPGSAHYGGGALDLRTRDLNIQQRQQIVAHFRGKGLTAVDEGDHIHVAMPRGGYTPTAGPGTVMASLQGRGPTGYGGTAATPGSSTVAALDAAYRPPSATASDADPISATPMARTSAAGQSPASVTNPGGVQTPTLPAPTPLSGALPPMNLAALGGMPAGGVGTIGAVPPQAAPAAPPVQVAQAGGYSPPFPVPPPQAAPTLPARPPAPQAAPQQAPTQAPAVAPAPVQLPVQQPRQARGPVDNSPLAHIPTERLIAVATHRGSTEGNRQLAIAELTRRSQLEAERNKPSSDYNDWLAAAKDGSFVVKDPTTGQNRIGTYPEWKDRYTNKGQVVQIGSGETKFVEEEGKARAALIGKEMQAANDALPAAIHSAQVVAAIEEIMPNMGGNFATAAALTAGRFGINTKGLNEAQAVQALLSTLIPKQREPGSGTTSDKDMAIFADMIPGLMKTPGANAMIFATMKTYADYQQKRARIARQWSTGALNSKDAMTQMQDLDDRVGSITTEAVRKAVAINREQAKREGATGDKTGLKDGSFLKKPEGMSPEDFADEKRALGYY